MDNRLHAGGSQGVAHQIRTRIEAQRPWLASPGGAGSASADAARPAPCREAPPTQDRDALFAELAPLVQRLIRRYGKTAELRRDLPGEIYYRFCGLLDAFDPGRGIPLRPYLIRQLTSATYTYARQHWRIAAREFALQDTELDIGFGFEEDPTGTWVQALSVQQVAACLPAAMERLPQRQRQVVIWRYYEERSFEEIALILGVKSATVRSLLRHGLAKLRVHIGAADCEQLEF